MEHHPGCFDIAVVFAEICFNFHVTAYHPREGRFEGFLTDADKKQIEFVMIRSTIGHWIISGESLPPEVFQYAQDIGRAFESHVGIR